VFGEEVFKAAGIPLKDLTAWGGRVDYVDFNTGLAQMKNGQTDLVVNMLSFPSAQVNGVARDVPIRVLALEPQVISKLSTEVGTKPVEIPAGTYTFEPKAVQTVTGQVMLLASERMTEEEAAAIVTGMIKNYDYLKNAYPPFSRMGTDSLADVSPLTLHHGAAKAYRAAGALK
jgi:TRAP transporter TAXI family solute receptor